MACENKICVFCVSDVELVKTGNSLDLYRSRLSTKNRMRDRFLWTRSKHRKHNLRHVFDRNFLTSRPCCAVKPVTGPFNYLLIQFYFPVRQATLKSLPVGTCLDMFLRNKNNLSLSLFFEDSFLSTKITRKEVALKQSPST
jgi:hypothetical protein